MKTIGVQEEVSEEEMAEEAVAEEDSDREGTLDLKKCTKQLVLNVVRNVKFHSNQKKEEMFSAKNVSVRRKDTKQSLEK